MLGECDKCGGYSLDCGCDRKSFQHLPGNENPQFLEDGKRIYMELRYYQKECIDILKKNVKKQLIQLPTGSGKTIIFLKYLSENSKKSLIIVPTLDLQQQVYENSLLFYHKDEVFLKTCKRPITKDFKIFIFVANSLNFEETRNFLLNQELDHIIIDEAHRSLAPTYKKFLELYTEHNSNYKLIGFTATPERLDRKCLLSLFEIITYKKTIYDLVLEGYLCNLECYRILTKHDIKSDGKSRDFKQIEIRHLDNYSRNQLIYQTYFENCLNKKTLIFCLSVDHAEKIADYLRKEKGVKAHHIHGKQSISNRTEILKKFRSGEIQVITNCQLLTEGFDEPSIEAIIIARPTKSKSLYCQMIGRGTRLFPGKEICSIYELTDNSHKICTFNVAADENKDENFIRDYTNGISLTKLHKEISEISLSDYILEKKEINIMSDFSSYLESKGLLPSQKKKLCEKSITFMEPINLLQASFMLFLENLKEKYGYN